MEETLGNVESYLDLSKHSGFLACWLEESALCKPKIMFLLQGIKEYSVPVGLDGKARVDLVVVGSVAVSEKGKIKPCNFFRRRVLSHNSQCHWATVTCSFWQT